MKVLTLCMILLMLYGCSSSTSMRVTKDNYTIATIEYPKKRSSIFDEPYRFFGDRSPNFMIALEDKKFIETVVRSPSTPKIQGDQLNILVLSGGGERGAFGAGVINGLYDSGTLPDFTLVTGVSTGALIAPFAFLGNDYIHKIYELMLKLNDEELLDKRNFLWPLYANSLVKGDKFANFIEETYSSSIIEAIANEHRKGRRLQIGTTHFDSGRQMIWNLGRIAASDLPEKEAIIRKILVASASIPGFFPPQYFDVYADGKLFEEMHVDGGLSHQLFFNPFMLDLDSISKAYGLTKKPNIYIIRNGFLGPEFTQVGERSIDIGLRSIDNLISSETIGDLYREAYMANSSNANVYLTFIGENFKQTSNEDYFFDPIYMKELYRYGYEMATEKSVWKVHEDVGKNIDLLTQLERVRALE